MREHGAFKNYDHFSLIGTGNLNGRIKWKNWREKNWPRSWGFWVPHGDFWTLSIRLGSLQVTLNGLVGFNGNSIADGQTEGRDGLGDIGLIQVKCVQGLNRGSGSGDMFENNGSIRCYSPDIKWTKGLGTGNPEWFLGPWLGKWPAFMYH